MNSTKFIALLATLALLAGCAPEGNRDEKPMPAPSTDQPKKEAQETPSKPQAWLAQTKDQAVAALEEQLQSMDAKGAELADKSQRDVGTARTEAEAAFDTLRSRREVAVGKLDELKSAGQDTWQNVKASFDRAWQELESAHDVLTSKSSG